MQPRVHDVVRADAVRALRAADRAVRTVLAAEAERGDRADAADAESPDTDPGVLSSLAQERSISGGFRKSNLLDSKKYNRDWAC